MIEVNLNRLSNASNDADRDRSCMETPRASLGLAFERIALSIDFSRMNSKTSSIAARTQACLRSVKLLNSVSMANLGNLYSF